MFSKIKHRDSDVRHKFILLEDEPHQITKCCIFIIQEYYTIALSLLSILIVLLSGIVRKAVGADCPG